LYDYYTMEKIKRGSLATNNEQHVKQATTVEENLKKITICKTIGTGEVKHHTLGRKGRNLASECN